MRTRCRSEVELGVEDEREEVDPNMDTGTDSDSGSSDDLDSEY